MQIGDGHLSLADLDGRWLRAASRGGPHGVARAKIGKLQRLADIVKVLRLGSRV